MQHDATPMRPGQRRRSLTWGHVNAALWAAGTALTSGTIVLYLARDLGATGLSVSLMLAAPNVAGLLRLGAPAVIYWSGTARRCCLQMYLASYLLVLGLPVVALAGPQWSSPQLIAALVGVAFAHQLLEYLGTVAQWSWWGDLVPLPVRGRYFARRQRFQLAASAPVLLAGSYFADSWYYHYRDQPEMKLVGYAIPIGLGALLLLCSLLPLLKMPATRAYPRPQTRLVGSAILAPFVDRRFWPLMIFRGWFSLANGISQLVQNVIYPKEILGFGLGPLAVMRVGMQTGQFAASRSVGKLSDYYGNRPVLVAAQVCVSASLLFFIVARPETRWLMAGAWVLYSAYVAHNICLPNLVLKLSPDVERPAYVAAAESAGSLLHATATVVGGGLFDYLRGPRPAPAADVYRASLILLVLGLAMRSFAVVLAAAIREPGAWTWREILTGRPSGLEEARD